MPALAEFMKGYDNIFRLNLPSKTLENSFLLMNRQIWTNAKEALMDRGEEGDEERGGVNGAECGLCQGRENTMHLMFECEEYSEKIWAQLGKAVTEMLAEEAGREGGSPANIRLHAFQVLYNINKAPIPRKHSKQVNEVIQEVKRSLVHRRYVRCTGGNRVRYNAQRISSHLLIALKKLVGFRKYQGRNADTVTALAAIVEGWIQD